MDSSISTAVVPIDRCFADSEELALAGFMASYRRSTRDAYAIDLRHVGLDPITHDSRGRATSSCRSRLPSLP